LLFSNFTAMNPDKVYKLFKNSGFGENIV